MKIGKSIFVVVATRTFRDPPKCIHKKRPQNLKVAAQGAPKPPKREGKWSQKRAWRHLVGSARTMVLTVREVYGRSRGGSGRRLFPDCVPRRSLEASWGAFFVILADLGCPLGCLGPPFWSQNGDLFQGLIFCHFLDHFWEGPAAGAGLPRP